MKHFEKKMPKKRRLTYGPEMMSSVGRSSNKRSRVSIGYPSECDWLRRMDGFDGVGVTSSAQDKKLKKSNLRVSAEARISHSDFDKSDSDADIEWTQSDDEENTKDPDKNKNYKPSVSAACPATAKQQYVKKESLTAEGTQNKSASMKILLCNHENTYEIESCTPKKNENNTDLDDEVVKSQIMPCSTPPLIRPNERTGALDEDFSPVISAADSLSAAEESDTRAGQGREKTSTWVQRLQWQQVTPEKLSMEDEADSGKKRKPKYTSGGLAQKLSRLTAREKSSYRVWQHQMQQKKMANKGSKLLRVQVVTCTSRDSILVCSCTVLEDSEASLPQSVHVLFQHHDPAQSLSEASVVDIHPPWQKLNVGLDQQDTVLCSHYVVRDQQQPEQPQTDQQSQQVLLATWACPCVKDHRMRPEKCPAQIQPYHCTSNQALACVGRASERFFKVNSQTHLDTIAMSQSPRLQTSDSILQAVERGQNGEKLQFIATVQRMYQRKNNEVPQWYILLQDTYGTFCEVLLSDCSSQSWSSLVQEGEGCCYRFSGLQVVDRLTRNRQAFSLMDSLWQPVKYKKILQSQQSSDDSDRMTSETSRPEFYYSFCTAPGESTASRLSQQTSALYSRPQNQELQEVIQMNDCRVSVWAKCVYLHQTERAALNQDSFVSLWYLIDTSTCYNRTRNSSDSPHVNNTTQRRPAVICMRQSEDCVISHTGAVPAVCGVKDALVSDGQLIADGYSVVTMPTDEEAKVHRTKHITPDYHKELTGLVAEIPPLCPTTPRLAMVTITGHLMSVDEDSAFTWLMCDRCNNEDIYTDGPDNTRLFCTVCNQEVVNAATGMKMTGYLTVDGQNCQAAIQLRQATIEALLPEDSDEEGYDLHTVLGQQLGPLVCIVQSVADSTTDGQHCWVLEEVDYKPTRTNERSCC